MGETIRTVGEMIKALSTFDPDTPLEVEKMCRRACCGYSDSWLEYPELSADNISVQIL